MAMNLNEIKELIDKIDETGIGEFKIEQADFKLSIRSKAYIEATQKGKLQVSQMMPLTTAVNPATQSAPQVPVVSNAASNNEAVNSKEQPQTAESTTNDKLLTIKAPMIGTFYRSSSPDKPPFVKVGDTISTGDTICIIEAMKLFNEIEGEVNGTIVKILADDASPVEYDQPIMLIEPA